MSLFLILFLSGCSNSEKPKTIEEIVKEESAIPKQSQTELSIGSPSQNKQEKQKVAEQPTQPATKEDLTYIAKYDGAILKTNLGDIILEFFSEDSPITVNNFLKLASEDFYDGVKFHRVIKDFMIQSGDPLSKDDNWNDDGTGGPGYKFKDEFNSHKLVKGSIAMANSGPNTNGSQFFIVTAPATSWLDGKHTNFGRVTKGMDVVEKIRKVETNKNDHPLEDVVIEDVKLIEKQ